MTKDIVNSKDWQKILMGIQEMPCAFCGNWFAIDNLKLRKEKAGNEEFVCKNCVKYN